MKNLILTLAILFVTSSIFAQKEVKKNSQAYFEVNGVCIMCKKRIEIASLKVKGIKMATWDIPSNIMSVVYDSNKVPLNALQSEIAKAGHDTPLVKADNTIYNKLPNCCLYRRIPIH